MYPNDMKGFAQNESPWEGLGSMQIHRWSMWGCQGKGRKEDEGMSIVYWCCGQFRGRSKVAVSVYEGGGGGGRVEALPVGSVCRG